MAGVSVDPQSWNEEWLDALADQRGESDYDAPRSAGGVMILGDPSDAFDD